MRHAGRSTPRSMPTNATTRAAPWAGVLAGPPEVHRRRHGGRDGRGRRRRGDSGLPLHHVSLRCELCARGPRPASRTLRARQAGGPDRSGGGRGRRRLGRARRGGGGPDHDGARRLDRSRTPRRRARARGRSPPFASRQPALLGSAGRDPPSRPGLPRHRPRHRSPRPPAAVRSARAVRSVRRPAEAPRPRGMRERHGEGLRRLHPLARALSVSRSLGPAGPASSTASASTAACGGRTGPAPSAC